MGSTLVYPPGSIVELSSGEVGIVLKPNHEDKFFPQVLVVRDAAKEPTERIVDLSKRTLDGRGAAIELLMYVSLAITELIWGVTTSKSCLRILEGLAHVVSTQSI